MNTSVSGKRFLFGGDLAAVGALFGRGLFAEPGIRPAPGPSSKDVPDFPDRDPQIEEVKGGRRKAEGGRRCWNFCDRWLEGSDE